MMDQAAVHAPVAVLKRMDVDEPEGGGRGLQHRIDAVVAHPAVGFDQRVHQVG